LVEIHTERFLLRELELKDVTERYLSWLHDTKAKQFIAFVDKEKDISDLKKYVQSRIGRDDILFLGIFEKATQLHIGNIKFEPVDSALGYAIMGMLIGDPDYRGIGVAAEVLRTSAQWLQKYRQVSQIVLGVSLDNPEAIRAYEKVGFVKNVTEFIPHVPPDAITMIWKLEGI
jgi:[ribosomal protein S5]-alanine N-acetyltransferase